ncbi:hypothetical protein Ahy_B04g069896 isoform D [Arachis hypogaea]|uniref:Uncharacterized protein n=1 Tax=Arachis hypogaea TaxID=3818 RepID=A0A444ZDV2_ARAHY|nr:hypothetical protein Ahy_B04g069896 isoform D [Arachis hypogaea]
MLFYRIPICVLRDDVKYDSFFIGSDKDLQVLFHCRHQFPEVRTTELLAKLVDVVCNSGCSNQNPQSSTVPTCSSLVPFGASSAMLVITHEAALVASSSFAANLNCSRDGEIGDTRPLGELAIPMVGAPIMVPVFGEGGVPDGVRDILHDDDDDDDVDPVTIADDSDDDIARTTPVVGGKASSSRTQQYPLHFQLWT